MVRKLGRRENKGRKEYMKSRVRAVKRFIFVKSIYFRTFNVFQKKIVLMLDTQRGIESKCSFLVGKP